MKSARNGGRELRVFANVQTGVEGATFVKISMGGFLFET